MYCKGKSVVVYIGLGSNLGERQKNLEQAAHLLEDTGEMEVLKMSTFYETEPVGYTEQGSFLNAVARVQTLLSPRELLRSLQKIEESMKRKRDIRWGPRTIDLDILFYNNAIIKEEDLIIPHERLIERAFVLVPLAEIAPGLVHPETGKKISQHLQELGEITGINRF